MANERAVSEETSNMLSQSAVVRNSFEEENRRMSSTVYELGRTH